MLAHPFATSVLLVVTAAATLAADLYSHRDRAEITLADAGKWSLIYVAVAFGFAAMLLTSAGSAAASLFLSGYVLEKILSIDNLLVFGAVFTYFGINEAFRHRILHIGIIGAVLFRLVFVTVGVSLLVLIGRPVEFLFGLFVAWSAYKLLKTEDDDAEVDHETRWYIKWARKVFPVVADASKNKFFVRAAGGLLSATPLLLCMVALEVTDVMFSFDSVPVVISVTRDPVLIYSAMVFAMMGLRSMYFVLAALQKYLEHLGKAVAVILGFVALKLFAHSILGVDVPPFTSLFIIAVILTAGVVASVLPKAERSAP
jgi:tellurite resistance protein TerC